MSITPVGKQKNQVNQGLFKNQITLGNVMDKIAITGMPNLDQPKSPNMGIDGLQDAMNSGGLDYEGQANQRDQMGMGEMPPSSSVSPNGPNELGSRTNHGISPFLQDDGLGTEESEMNQALLMERQKIQKALGGSGFVMDLSNSGKDGGIKLILTPQQGFQLTSEKWEQLLQRLAQAGINPTSISDPDASGRTVIVYNNNAGPQKVTKR